jgi:hypothetical protein
MIFMRLVACFVVALGSLSCSTSPVCRCSERQLGLSHKPIEIDLFSIPLEWDEHEWLIYMTRFDGRCVAVRGTLLPTASERDPTIYVLTSPGFWHRDAGGRGPDTSASRSLAVESLHPLEDSAFRGDVVVVGRLKLGPVVSGRVLSGWGLIQDARVERASDLDPNPRATLGR